MEHAKLQEIQGGERSDIATMIMRKNISVYAVLFFAVTFAFSGFAPAAGRETDDERASVVAGGWLSEAESGGNFTIVKDGSEIATPVSARSVRMGEDGGVIELDDGDYIILGGDDDGDVKVKKSDKKRAYLGIHMEELCGKLSEKYDYPKESGVIVTDVVEDSPAEEAGLKENDIIYSLDGEVVADPAHLADMVGEKKPGEKVEIEYYRDGKKHVIDVKLAEHSWEFYSFDWEDFSDYADDVKFYAKSLGKTMGRVFATAAPGLRGRLGVKLVEINEDLAGYFNVKEDEGVLVLEVVEESPAEKAGIKAGDVIVKVAGNDVCDVEDVHDELSSLDGDKEFEIEIVRKGKKQQIKVEFDKESIEDVYLFSPRERARRIRIPDVKRLEKPRMDAMDRQIIKEEIKDLKKHIKELEERLKELEKD
jgi:C-terminal processing protease CtpA/Prc